MPTSLTVEIRKPTSQSLSGRTLVDRRASSGTALSEAITFDRKLSDGNYFEPEWNPSRSTSFIKKRFPATWAQKREDKDEEDARGAVGLRLLHSSPEPLIELVFVHGLRGGSTKTWRKGGDPRLFWPQYWLPVETGFKNVNIYSFGYESDWASTKSSILNVHDFGESLFEEMRNSPSLRSNDNSPIILLGHSMGGLVIKKAFILAMDTSDFKDRIRCIFFLGTPHRGSDYAGILNNILTVSGLLTSRDYIRDLTTGSTSTHLINEEFGKFAYELPIFSFYETLRMKLGITSNIIVGKDSALLGPGFRNERAQYLNASHRDMCKFDSPEDPNYITLKNALSGAIHDLLKDISGTKREESIEQMRMLKSLLAVSDRPDEQHQKVDGSCQWIDGHIDFQEWRDSTNDGLTMNGAEPVRNNPFIIWVHANPGTGKTVLAAHVTAELQEFQVECAYYYFHVGDKTSRSLGDFLRSIAYQMAMSNARIREKLAKLWQEGSTFDLDDNRTIWNKVFKRGIFQARVYTPQFWVVDALDECNRYQEFFTMLKGEKPNFPLRIFITSRNVPDMLRLYRPLQLTMSLVSIEIPVTHSMHDIDCYIRSRIENLSLHSTADRDELASNLLLRSNANFLWVRLVLDELEKVYSNESMLQVLQGIPEGMIPYYERTTRAMADNKLEKHIAKAILVWVVASSRKMNTMELGNALRLDINTVLPDVKVAVEGLCGQLISVDEHTDLVDVIHATAREFLLSEAAGEFMISKPRANERIALTCLKILSSNEMHPPRRGSNRRPAAQDIPDPPPFLDYALTQFSEHVYNASSETDAILLAMDRFFRTNVLSWIEKVSSKRDLHVLIRTSKNLRAYLDRRAKYRSPLSNQVKNIDGWSIDLSRLVTKFGAALCQNASSIYFLIPPLCPSGSAIYQQFGKRPTGLAVVGFKSETWDDCIASVSFEEDRPVAVSCGENLIAVGMSSGNISLYNQQTCQKQGVLRNQYPVDIIHFADSCVVTCTIKSIVLQDLQGKTLWESRLRFRCILLTSSGKSIFAVSQHGHVLKWDMDDGTLQSDESFEYRNHDVDCDYNQLTSRAPAVASISPDMEILALGYRGGTVCLWDLQNGEFIGWARDGEDRLAAKMLFNPNPNVNILLVIYTNHDLFLFETWSGVMVFSQKPPHDSGVLSASCSPDGRTLVTTDTRGNLQIWDFGSLTLLYNLESPFAPLRVLDFTSDGLSIVDVTHSGMRIWSPAALIRENIEDDASISDMANQLSITKAQYEPLRSSRITAISSHPSLPVVFAGNCNGEVKAFSTKNGEQLSELYTHPQKDRVNKIAVSTSNFIASSDSNGVIQVWKLSSGRPTIPKPESLLLQVQSRAPVKQLCFSCLGDYLLIASTRSDQVYSVKDGFCVGVMHFDSQERKVWRWLPIPSQAAGEEFGLVAGHVFKKFTAQKFPSLVADVEVRLQFELNDGEVETNINSLALDAETQTLVLDLRHDSHHVSSSTMFLFDFSQKASSSPPANLNPLYRTPIKSSEHFIGISKTSKSFVMYNNSWLSSIDLVGLAESTYRRHFFVPNEYLPGRRETHDVQTLMTAEDDIVFCLYGELVIVKNGLKFQETKKLELGL